MVRHGLFFAAGMVLSNALGAVVTFVYTVVITAPLRDRTAQSHLRLNGLVFLVYLVTALLIGLLWSLWRFRFTLAWLLADRFPDELERRLTLRQPGRQLVVHGCLWTAGVLLFVGLNVGYSWRIALDVALATALGGLFTCATGYLLAERLLRPVTTIALAHGGPDAPAVPGVVSRVVWAWAVGTGVPLLGAGMALIARRSSGRIDADTPVLLLLILGLVASLFTMLLLARSIAAPTAPLRHAVQSVSHGELDADVPVTDAGEIGQLQHAWNDMLDGLRESEQLRDLFGRQVGVDVARQALARGVQLGGENRQVAVLFVDLDGSTAFAHSHAPQEVMSLLNVFFRVVVDVIDSCGGVINKFQGDGALCVFGVPLPHPDAAAAALRAGRLLRDRVADLDDEQISVGVGIAAGTVVAGNVGAESRFEYTVIGDPVNEAARLTDLAKRRGEGVVASEAVLSAAHRSETERWQVNDSVVLEGRAEPTRLASPR